MKIKLHSKEEFIMRELTEKEKEMVLVIANDKISLDQATSISYAIMLGVDVLKYTGGEYSAEQINQIFIALNEQFPVEVYFNKMTAPEKMKALMYAYRHNPDMLGMAKSIPTGIFDITGEYGPVRTVQTRENILRLILKDIGNNIEFNKYMDIKYTYEQMKEIHIGLNDKLPTELYADSKIPADKMRVMRETIGKLAGIYLGASEGFDF